MSKGTGDVSLLSMDVMSYSRCVVLVFSPVVSASQTESRGSKRAASGQKGFRYVSPFLTSKRVCTLLLLVDYCHAFLDGGIVEKEKKKMYVILISIPYKRVHLLFICPKEQY